MSASLVGSEMCIRDRPRPPPCPALPCRALTRRALPCPPLPCPAQHCTALPATISKSMLQQAHVVADPETFCPC
eukprot:12035628-Alexandrium_andersonii.AAC.1